MGKLDTESIIGGSLALVGSFAWRDFFTGVIDQNDPLKKDNVQAKFVYAVIITMIIFVLFYCYICACETVCVISPTVDRFFSRREKALRFST